MNESKMMTENTSLFLDLDQAVRRLEEAVINYEHSEVLMVVLCQDAMPVANKIARRLGLNLMFTALERDVKSTDLNIGFNFDYRMIKESGRDIPQDFVYHKEQSLRSNLVSTYEGIYNNTRSAFPDKFIILIDELINNGTEFFPSDSQRENLDAEGNTFSMLEFGPEKSLNSYRHFVFFHACYEYSGNEVKHNLDIIIEHEPL